MGNPIVRGSWPLGLVRFAETYEPLKVPLAERLPEDCAAELGKARRFSWIPFETYHALIETLRLELGGTGLEAMLEAYVAGLYSSPLYKPLLGGVELFGSGAVSIVRLYARGFTLAFKDAGAMTVRPREGASGVHLTLAELPPPCRKMAYAHGHVGALAGGFALVKSKAKVTMDVTRLESEGVIEYDALEV